MTFGGDHAKESDDLRTVFLIGTSHEHQRLRLGANDPGSEQLRALLTVTARQYHVRAIAEEMSIEGLSDHGAHDSVGRQVADALRLPHRYCDPSREERKALGVVEEDDIHMSAFMAGRDAQQVEAAIRASHAIREERWLQHVFALDTWPVLFICGANHTEAFRDRLEKNSIDTHVLFKKWTPN